MPGPHEMTHVFGTHTPKPEIPPSPRILQKVMDRDADWEAAD